MNIRNVDHYYIRRIFTQSPELPIPYPNLTKKDLHYQLVSAAREHSEWPEISRINLVSPILILHRRNYLNEAEPQLWNDLYSYSSHMYLEVYEMFVHGFCLLVNGYKPNTQLYV